MQAPFRLPSPCAPREALLARISAAARLPHTRIVCLDAPTGSGKSVAAALWLEGAGIPAAWLCLDGYSNSGALLFRELARAMMDLQPHNQALASTLGSRRFSPQGFAQDPVGRAAQVAASLLPGGKPCALVLDGLQHIRAAKLLSGLLPVLGRLPKNCLVLALSSAGLPQQWQEGQREGAVDVITGDALRFSEPEICAYFASLGKPLTVEEGGFAYLVSDGLAAGVQALAAQAVRMRSGQFSALLLASAARLAAAGTSLPPLPMPQPPTQPSPPLSPPQLQPQPPLPPSQPQLPQLSPKTLHRQAASYYRERDDHSRALRHRLASGAYNGLDSFIYNFLFGTSAPLPKESIAQHTDFLRSVFANEFPQAAFRAAPSLYSLRAWYYWLTGDHQGFERDMDALVRRLPRVATGERKLLEFAVAAYSADYRSSICTKLRRFGRIARYARLFTAEGLGPTVVSITHNMPYLHRSNIDYFEIILEKDGLSRLGATFGLLLESEWDYLHPCLEAGIAYERNQLEPALAANTRALGLYQEANRSEGLVCLLVLQHSLLWRMGLLDEAGAALGHLRGFTAARAPFFSANLAAYESRLALLDGSAAAAREWLASPYAGDLAALASTRRIDFLSSYAYFSTARALVALGETEKAAGLIDALIGFGRAYHRKLDTAEALVLKTALCWAKGQREEATAALAEALALMAPYGFIRVFADEGAAILPALKRLAYGAFHKGPASGLERPYLQEVLLATHGFAKKHGGICAAYGRGGQGYRGSGAGGGAEQVRQGSAVPVRLSRRQRQMLELLAEGYNNPQISQTTGLALPTVKTHLFYAYQKLDVNTAMDAVLKARELGLL